MPGSGVFRFTPLICSRAKSGRLPPKLRVVRAAQTRPSVVLAPVWVGVPDTTTVFTLAVPGVRVVMPVIVRAPTVHPPATGVTVRVAPSPPGVAAEKTVDRPAPSGIVRLASWRRL